jgi:hypothetical protein
MNAELQASRAAKAYFSTLDFDHIGEVRAEIENPDNSDDTAANSITPPCVIFWAQDAREFPMQTGNYYLDLHMRVIGGGEMTADQFRALFNEATSALHTDTIAEDLSDALDGEEDGFHCFGVAGEVSMAGPRVDGQNRVSEMVLPIYCCALDVS